MTRYAAIIPARSGSKRVPGKNLQTVGGRSLVAIAVDCAREAGLPAYVSTDGAEIGAVAAACGAIVVARPAALATDTATTESVIWHWLSTLPADERPTVGFVLLQPTSPLRRPESVRRAIDLCERGGYDAVWSVTPEPPAEFLGVLDRHENGDPMWRPNQPQGTRPRTQDCAPVAREDGAIYVTRLSWWDRARDRLAPPASSSQVLLDPIESLDVDTPEDLALANRLWAATRGEAVRRAREPHEQIAEDA